MWRRAANVAWWLGLSAYFGGILTVGTIAPAVFRQIREARIAMPGVTSPPLDVANHTGGEVFGAILAQFAYLEVIALGIMLTGLAGFLFSHTPVRRSVWVLMLLWMLLATVLGYDAAILRPGVLESRAQLRQTASLHVNNTAGSTATAWPERARFDRLHQRSTAFARVKGYLLLGMLLVSAWRGLADVPTGRSKLTRAELMRDES